MPSAWGNPKHITLPVLVGNNLHQLPLHQRWRLAGIISTLYKFRIIADYQPNVTLEEPDARICLSLMADVFRSVQGIP